MTGRTRQAQRRPAPPRGRWTWGAVLPVMGVLTVVAVAFGFFLGESAIRQIDPLYFRGAAPLARDVTADARPAPRSTFADASGWDQGQLAVAHDCGADCPALRAREAGIAPSSLGIGEVAALPGPSSVPPAPVFSETPITTADGAPQGRTNRYLHYPVSSEPEPAPPSFSEPKPAPARGDPEGM